MSLLHSIFLIMCVCVCVCVFHLQFYISWKMAGSDEHGVCTRVCFVLGTNAMETTGMMHVAFRGQTVEGTQLLNGFPSLKVT
jgi:hypothetical protein